jgi:hypothetical protein
MAELLKKKYNLFHYIIKIIPKYLYNNLNLNDKVITLNTNKNNLFFLRNFLKYN